MVGVPCGKINTIEEALKHPQIEPCRMIQTLNHSKLGSIELVGPAVKIEGFETEPTAPPTLGQDTKTILKELLNKTPEEIEALYEAKVI